MKRKGTTGLKISMAAAIFAVFLTFFLFFYIITFLQRGSRVQSVELSYSAASAIARSIEGYFNEAYNITKNYASDLLVAEKNNLPRESVYSLLKGSLETDVSFLAVWTIFDPDRDPGPFDPERSLRQSKPGTFGISYRAKAGIITQEIDDTASFSQAYYTIPRSTKKPVILEPYFYEYINIQGSFYETSIVTPVVDEGEFVGVVGIDIDLKSLQERFSQVEVGEGGFVTIIAHSGQIVTHRDSRYINTRYFSFCGADSTEIIKKLKTGEGFNTEGLSEFTGVKSYRYYYPLKFEDISRIWYVMIEIPETGIMSGAEKIKRSSFYFLIASLFLLGYLLFNISDRKRREKEMVENINELEATGSELNHLKANLEQIAAERIAANLKLNSELLSSNEELNSVNEALFRQKTELESSLQRLNDAQEKMLISEKMASLGVMASGVAHEINNPLNFIQGGLNAIEQYFSERFPEHLGNIEPLLNAIRTGVLRSTEIVKSLSHYSRSDTALNQNCSINFIIENCLTILQSEIRDRIFLRKYYSENDFGVYGNPGKLHQAFLNILSNAVKAIKKGGTIRVQIIRKGTDIHVSILDNGSGIEKKDIERIFDPFFTTRTPGEGVGLGLSIAQSIIHEHNGSISVTSEPGMWTRVVVLLPAAK